MSYDWLRKLLFFQDGRNSWNRRNIVTGCSTGPIDLILRPAIGISRTGNKAHGAFSAVPRCVFVLVLQCVRGAWIGRARDGVFSRGRGVRDLHGRNT